jgi:hypothetical protein
MPNRASHKVGKRVLAARQRLKRGTVAIAARLGLNASTVGQILARNGVPHLAAMDPIISQSVRSSRRSDNRYEHHTPGG